jgi:hypothetical protein
VVTHFTQLGPVSIGRVVRTTIATPAWLGAESVSAELSESPRAAGTRDEPRVLAELEEKQLALGTPVWTEAEPAVGRAVWADPATRERFLDVFDRLPWC